MKHIIIWCLVTAVLGKSIKTLDGHHKLHKRHAQNKAVAKANYVDTESLLDKIVGGSDAGPGEIPWQASVKTLDLVGGIWRFRHHCGATILNEYWLLSAVHCYIDNPKFKWRVAVGEISLSQTDAGEQVFEVENIYNHELYGRHRCQDQHISADIAVKTSIFQLTSLSRPAYFSYETQLDYDVALIKIKPSFDGTGIKFNDMVKPICINSRVSLQPGDELLMSGWGQLSEDNATAPDILQKATLPLIDHKKCKELYPCRITDRMICAGYLDGTISGCYGDSGGPLVYGSGGNIILFGVVSWGYGCARPNSPGVYADVNKLSDWIQKTINVNSDNSPQSVICLVK